MRNCKVKEYTLIANIVACLSFDIFLPLFVPLPGIVFTLELFDFGIQVTFYYSHVSLTFRSRKEVGIWMNSPIYSFFPTIYGLLTTGICFGFVRLTSIYCPCNSTVHKSGYCLDLGIPRGISRLPLQY